MLGISWNNNHCKFVLFIVLLVLPKHYLFLHQSICARQTNFCLYSKFLIQIIAMKNYGFGNHFLCSDNELLLEITPSEVALLLDFCRTLYIIQAKPAAASARDHTCTLPHRWNSASSILKQTSSNVKVRQLIFKKIYYTTIFLVACTIANNYYLSIYIYFYIVSTVFVASVLVLIPSAKNPLGDFGEGGRIVF